MENDGTDNWEKSGQDEVATTGEQFHSRVNTEMFGRRRGEDTRAVGVASR